MKDRSKVFKLRHMSEQTKQAVSMGRLKEESSAASKENEQKALDKQSQKVSSFLFDERANEGSKAFLEQYAQVVEGFSSRKVRISRWVGEAAYSRE